jgi:hypothetical protein
MSFRACMLFTALIAIVGMVLVTLIQLPASARPIYGLMCGLSGFLLGWALEMRGGA